ncbi:MAG TPA: twin-arginine translocase TatA/TatE family subunit [Anaeromyxobacteraceae bacterium]|nr:twin-arginine translocase TatA/TatE family subunit [Anaeromyxobacteraceae bacterium]
MFGLGFGELLVILFVLVLFFGANKLPALGKGLGDGIRSFRQALKEAKSDDAGKPGSKP